MPVNTGGDDYGNSNCGMCTVGGIFDGAGIHGRSDGFTTTDVARFLKVNGQSDDHLAAAFGARRVVPAQHGNPTYVEHDLERAFAEMGSLLMQMRNNMLHNTTPVSRFGSRDHPLSANDLARLMRMYPTGTRFAVWGSLQMFGHGAHWNVAERTAGGVEFRDYQDDDGHGAPGPTRSQAFIAPRTNRHENPVYQKFLLITCPP